MPPLMRTKRLQYWAARLRSCTAARTARFSSRHRLLIRSRISTWRPMSRFAVGSSSSIAFVSWASARAMRRHCICPPASSPPLQRAGHHMESHVAEKGLMVIAERDILQLYVYHGGLDHYASSWAQEVQEDR